MKGQQAGQVTVPGRWTQELPPALSALEWPSHGSAMLTSATGCIVQYSLGKRSTC